MKCRWRWRSNDKPCMTENVIVRPTYDLWGQNKNSESLLQICNTCPIISLSINCDLVWKCSFSLIDKLTEKRKSRFSILIWPLGIKLKFWSFNCTSTRHTQSYPRVSFVNFLKCRQSSSDNNVTWLSIDPWAQKRYYAPARHAQSDARTWFGYDIRCRRSSSDNFFGRTDSYNYNIPNFL